MKPYSETQVLPLRLIAHTRQSNRWQIQAFNYRTGAIRYLSIGSQTVLCKALFRNYNPKNNLQIGEYFLLNEITRHYRKGDRGNVSYRGIPKQKWIPWREANLEYFIW